MTTLFKPASEPSIRSMTLASKLCFSQNLKYIRKSISAQSWASTPPVPAWMDKRALPLSYSPENKTENSNWLKFSVNFFNFKAISAAKSPPFSVSLAKPSNSSISTFKFSHCWSSDLISSYLFDSPLAFSRSDQKPGADIFISKSNNSSFFRSRSKQPPNSRDSLLQFFNFYNFFLHCFSCCNWFNKSKDP